LFAGGFVITRYSRYVPDSLSLPQRIYCRKGNNLFGYGGSR
jgi:hypothetical protein